ncbi:hypothetical protein ABS71_19620 [bacterium SCN 62-11]|nr:hypothetical protein [Candidatus Eremiobacteraeota bacterium]ODT57591.1 MAG: hypothetical protein ABS71_19620 [bacterium SCN 62-11]
MLFFVLSALALVTLTLTLYKMAKEGTQDNLDVASTLINGYCVMLLWQAAYGSSTHSNMYGLGTVLGLLLFVPASTIVSALWWARRAAK